MNPKIKRISKHFFYYLAVLLFLIFNLGPILWSFSMSITPKQEFTTTTTDIVTKNPTGSNYYQLLVSSESKERPLFLKGFMNSLIVSILSFLIGIPIAFFCSYALVHFRFKGRKMIRDVLLVTMAIPIFATLIPLYKFFATLHLLNNIFGLILVYITMFLPITVWIISSNLESFPKEIVEAGEVDGCSNIQIIYHLLLPLVFPILIATALIIFLTTWNQFLVPLILAPSNSTKPLAVIISEFVTKTTVNYGLMNASGIIAIIPPAVLAIFFRKYLVKGIVSGATKG